jgi:hypothetical protein
MIGISWVIALTLGFLTMLWEVEGEECTFDKVDPVHIFMCHTIGKMLPYFIVVVCYGFIFNSIWKVRLFLFKKLNRLKVENILRPRKT